MRLLVALAALVVLALGAASAAHADAAPGVLYALSGERATVTHVDPGFRLSLPAATTVTWFTDRPARRAGTTTLRTLAALWNASGFRADPPNAALILRSPAGDRMHVVELRAPRASAGRVSFAIRAEREATEAGHRHVDPLAVGAYREADLFIDDAAVPPCGATMTASPTASPVQCLLSGRATVTASASGAAVLVGCVATGSASYVSVGNQSQPPESVVIDPCTPSTADDATLAFPGLTAPTIASTCASLTWLAVGSTVIGPSNPVVTVRLTLLAGTDWSSIPSSSWSEARYSTEYCATAHWHGPENPYS